MGYGSHKKAVLGNFNRLKNQQANCSLRKIEGVCGNPGQIQKRGGGKKVE